MNSMGCVLKLLSVPFCDFRACMAFCIASLFILRFRKEKVSGLKSGFPFGFMDNSGCSIPL